MPSGGSIERPTVHVKTLMSPQAPTARIPHSHGDIFHTPFYGTLMGRTVLHVCGMKLLGFAFLGLLAQTSAVSSTVHLPLGDSALSAYDAALFTPR